VSPGYSLEALLREKVGAAITAYPLDWTSGVYKMTIHEFHEAVAEVVDKKCKEAEIEKSCEQSRQKAIAEQVALSAIAAARTAEEKQRKQEALELFSAAVRAWIDEHGPDHARERQAAGLLNQEEALTLIRNSLFATLADAPRYERIRGGEIQHEEDCNNPDDDPTGIVEQASSVSMTQWAALKELRASGLEVTPQLHRMRCDHCYAVVERLSARVEVPFGGRYLSRLYALPEE
jgi:hypothetical protein